MSTKKLQSGLRKLSGRWKGSQAYSKMESAYSESNISAIPHYGEFIIAGHIRGYGYGK
jgi:hypothetical protein